MTDPDKTSEDLDQQVQAKLLGLIGKVALAAVTALILGIGGWGVKTFYHDTTEQTNLVRKLAEMEESVPASIEQLKTSLGTNNDALNALTTVVTIAHLDDDREAALSSALNNLRNPGTAPRGGPKEGAEDGDEAAEKKEREARLEALLQQYEPQMVEEEALIEKAAEEEGVFEEAPSMVVSAPPEWQGDGTVFIDGVLYCPCPMLGPPSPFAPVE